MTKSTEVVGKAGRKEWQTPELKTAKIEEVTENGGLWRAILAGS